MSEWLRAQHDNMHAILVRRKYFGSVQWPASLWCWTHEEVERIQDQARPERDTQISHLLLFISIYHSRFDEPALLRLTPSIYLICIMATYLSFCPVVYQQGTRLNDNHSMLSVRFVPPPRAALGKAGNTERDTHELHDIFAGQKQRRCWFIHRQASPAL